MKKYMKLALEEEQIAIKECYKRFNGYEIHLHGDDRDNFSLAAYLKKPIITVHYPIRDCDVYDVVSNYKSEYAQKVFAFVKEVNAGLVVHAETDLDKLLTHPDLDAFCEFIRNEEITLHVENCYRNCGAVESLRTCHYLRDKIGEDYVYPLLDTCHLMMSQMSFKFEENSFFKTIDAYSSPKFILHLNDCIGSGERETGGIHGTNFYANQYLLWNILWKLKEVEKKENLAINLVLEVDEEDYNHPKNAEALAEDVDSMWRELDTVINF